VTRRVFDAEGGEAVERQVEQKRVGGWDCALSAPKGTAARAAVYGCSPHTGFELAERFVFHLAEQKRYHWAVPCDQVSWPTTGLVTGAGMSDSSIGRADQEVAGLQDSATGCAGCTRTTARR
jgi:hypothetical protein